MSLLNIKDFNKFIGDCFCSGPKSRNLVQFQHKKATKSSKIWVVSKRSLLLSGPKMSNNIALPKPFFFGCQLLGYVFRAVRPSVSYSNAKRTIPVRKKQEKEGNGVSNGVYGHGDFENQTLAKTMKQVNETNSKTN